MRTRVPVSPDNALDVLEVRITTARDLVSKLPFSQSDPFHLQALTGAASRVYARATVWLGEDPACLADEAHQVYEGEQIAAGYPMLDPTDLEDVAAPAERLAEILAFITAHGDRPQRYDHAQAHALCVNILACLMHAEYSTNESDYEVYDACGLLTP